MKTNAQYFIRNSLLSITSFVISFILNAKISQNFSHAVFGDYRFGISMMILLSTLIPLGRDNLIKIYYREYDSESQTLKYTLTTWILKSITKYSSVFTLLLVLYFSTAIIYLNTDLYHFFLSHPVHIILLVTPIVAFRNTFLNTMYANNLQDFATLCNQLLANLVLLIAVYYIMLHYQLNYMTITVISIIFVASRMLSTLVLYIINQKKLIGTGTTPTQAHLTQWKSESINLFINKFTFALASQSILILLEFLGRESAPGQASIIIIIVSIIFISITPLNTYLSTMVRLKVKDLSEMHTIQIHHNRLKLAIIIVVATLMITFSEHLLGFFGQHSLILKNITTIAILLSCMWDYSYTATYYLLFTYHGALNNKIQIVSVSLQIAALIIFIPFYDLWAAIIIPFIGGISTQIYISRTVKRLIGLNPLALY